MSEAIAIYMASQCKPLVIVYHIYRKYAAVTEDSLQVTGS